jgi:hypothetical protein
MVSAKFVFNIEGFGEFFKVPFLKEASEAGI